VGSDREVEADVSLNWRSNVRTMNWRVKKWPGTSWSAQHTVFMGFCEEMTTVWRDLKADLRDERLVVWIRM